MENFLSQLDISTIITSILVFLPKLGLALLILVIFWLVYRITRKPLTRILQKAHFEEALIQMLIYNVYRFTLFLVGLIMAVSQVGVNVGALLAGIGVVGIALGLAAQDSLSNIMAGFLIFWDKPFKVQDWISIGDLYGKVVEITMRSTRIRTKENTYIIIPNQKIINETLTNHSKHGELRLNIPIGIAFKESIPAARQVLLKAVKSTQMIMAEPQPDVVVKQVGESSVDLMVRVWIADAKDETEIFYDTLEICKLALDKAGIQIPFPHRQLFLEDVKTEVMDRIMSPRSANK
jgi:small conductance mechanosensitive channel